MTAAFTRLRGTQATVEDKVADLVEFHSANPGMTEASLGQWRMADGRTGYELLVAQLRPGDQCVVEVGAGNGPLLEVLSVREPPVFRIIGIDACAKDLELARKRLGSRVTLHESEAHELPLADATADAVLSHHALYLFEPADAALAEVCRILKPGGRLSAVGWTLAPKDESVFARLMGELAKVNHARLPNFRGWADPRWFEEQSLTEMCLGAGFDNVTLSEHTLSIDESANVICKRLMDFLYSVHMHDDEAKHELQSAWLAILNARQAPMELPFSLLHATRG